MSVPGIDPFAVPSHKQSVRQRELDGDLLLYFHKDQPGVTLNNSARAIWEMCDGQRNVLAISQELGRQFDLHESAFIPDVQKVVSEFAQSGLLVVESGAAQTLGDIDWSRMAAPQSDGYDARTALELVAAHGDLSQDYAPVGAPTLIDGDVKLAHCYSKTNPNCTDTAVDHPNIQGAVSYLRRYWPEALAQFRLLVKCFHPVIDPQRSLKPDAFLTGAYSHSDESMFGTLWVTVNCPLMLAECFVHEAAHIKLFALGVYKESSIRFVKNLPEELYKSPVITDRPRPMTAVFHGVYAFVHVTELDIRVLPHIEDNDRHARLKARLQRNLNLVEQGLAEVQAHIKLDKAGQQFVSALYRWIDGLLDRGRSLT